MRSRCSALRNTHTTLSRLASQSHTTISITRQHSSCPTNRHLTSATSTGSLIASRVHQTSHLPHALSHHQQQLRTTMSSSAEATGPEAANLKVDPTVDTSPAAPTDASNTTETETPEEKKLPPLSAHEFRQYNRLAEHMNYFHEHFRHTWNTLWTAATTGKRPAGMSIRTFLTQGLQFISQLTLHHNIEEQHIFPILAKRMPEFKSGKGSKDGGAAELLRQHKEIHKGMDLLEEYLSACQSGEKDLEMSVLKEKMETWGGVLWKHLDQEVETLGAENMRKFWSIEEIRRIPM